MPAYDYKCPECEEVGEVFHLMTESPTYICPDCHVEMKRVYNSFGLNHGHRLANDEAQDKIKGDSDMKQEMKEDFGVEKFQPIAATSLKEVYKDVKTQGSFVKERMQAETERTSAAKRKKEREWKKGAMKRAPKRSQEIVERKKAEAAKKRAISISI